MHHVRVDLEFEMNDVRRVKLQRTPLQVLQHYLYSILKPFLVYEKKVLDDLILYDNGMKIVDSFIPYECEGFARPEAALRNRALTVAVSPQVPRPSH